MSDQDEKLDITNTLEQFLENCLDNGMAVRSVICYRNYLKVWQNFLQNRGITSLAEITRECLLDYRHYLQAIYRGHHGRPIATSTQVGKLAALKSYLNFCAQNGNILFNPADQLPLPKVPKSLPRGILTKHQMKKLLNLPDTKTLTGFRDRVILELFYSTGIRREELVSIKIQDCHLSEGSLFIRKGKGGRQRWVPLGKKISNILLEYLQRVRPAMVKDKRHQTLIVGDKGGEVKGDRVYKIVFKYFKRLGVKSDCHGLRHTCATHLLKGKANIRLIQSLLGHVSLSSTQIYTHVDISDMQQMILKLHPRESMKCNEELYATDTGTGTMDQ